MDQMTNLNARVQEMRTPMKSSKITGKMDITPYIKSKAPSLP